MSAGPDLGCQGRAVGAAKGLRVVPGSVATTMQSTSAPGIFTWRGLRLFTSASRSTCAITSPPQLCAAIATDSVSQVSASRSIVMLPAGSAVVPRMIATLTGNAL